MFPDVYKNYTSAHKKYLAQYYHIPTLTHTTQAHIATVYTRYLQHRPSPLVIVL